MTDIYGARQTLAPENQFIIECPVFHTDVKIASCFMLRDMVTRGEQPAVRAGCQVALQASKCPINHILKDMMRKHDDPYHSPTPKKGPLRADVLQRIAPILIHEPEIERNARLSDAERQRLLQVNQDATPVDAGGGSRTRRRKKSEETVTLAPTTTQTAATTGDMAAAVNAEVKAQENASDQV